jgi:hypothetical protein
MKRRTALKFIFAPAAMKVRTALGGWPLSAGIPATSQLWVEDREEAKAGELALVAGGQTSDIYVDPADFEVVKIAAGLMADDIERVTGKRPAIKSNATQLGANAVILGTLGKSRVIHEIAAAGQLDSSRIQGRWEGYGIKLVHKPMAGVAQALVIAGSDRRGTAYGVMEISRRIGVSPFYWWADVPVRKRPNLILGVGNAQISASPSVKYRGIFINDELWGFLPWEMGTFDPGEDVGPKTYRKIFEVMLRLRLNYLWPSGGDKHEFGAVPGNCALADDWAMVMGSSHAEPILRSPASWNVATEGPWDYPTNRARMLAFWKEWAQARGKYEAVWTVGLRGNGDLPMIGQTEAGQIAILNQALRDQRELLREYVVPARDGKIAQDLVLYNEVLRVLDDGLKVPPDVTLVWPDDNWGYVRQLPNAAQQERPGGSGVYYHVDYSGQPHDHCWFSATPPAQIWEEMRKAWDNGARTLWVVNVGKIKAQEIDTDFWARFAWNIDEFGPESQPAYLKNFAEESFGRENADEISSILAEFFRLCSIRKPDTMGSALCVTRPHIIRSVWAAALPSEFADLLLRQYQSVLDRAEKVAQKLPEEASAAYFELVLYPVRMLCASGSTFINYERYRNSLDQPPKSREYAEAVTRWNRIVLENTDYYNTRLAGGKWKRMMTLGGSDTGFCALYKLPNIDSTAAEQIPTATLAEQTKWSAAAEFPTGKVLGAAQFSRKFDVPPVRWQAIEGLGWSGRAMAWEKMVAANRWEAPGDLGRSPRLEYDIRIDDATSDFSVRVHLLPTFQLNPSMPLRVAASVDQGVPQLLEVPGSRCSDDNKTGNRDQTEMANRVTVEFAFGANGRNLRTVKIWTPDPGVVLDQIEIRVRK